MCFVCIGSIEPVHLPTFSFAFAQWEIKVNIPYIDPMGRQYPEMIPAQLQKRFRGFAETPAIR